jgi:hypothetical protein
MKTRVPRAVDHAHAATSQSIKQFVWSDGRGHQAHFAGGLAVLRETPDAAWLSRIYRIMRPQPSN